MIEDLKRIVARATDTAPRAIRVAFRTPVEYQSNRLYDVWTPDRHLVVKEFLKPDEFHEAPVREFRALELLAPLDIAPQPVFFQPVSPPLRPMVVYEFMEGQMWNRHRPSDGELARLAELCLTYSRISGDDLWLSRGYDRPLDEKMAPRLSRYQTYVDWVETVFGRAREAVDLCSFSG